MMYDGDLSNTSLLPTKLFVDFQRNTLFLKHYTENKIQMPNFKKVQNKNPDRTHSRPWNAEQIVSASNQERVGLFSHTNALKAILPKQQSLLMLEDAPAAKQHGEKDLNTEENQNSGDSEGKDQNSPEGRDQNSPNSTEKFLDQLSQTNREELEQFYADLYHENCQTDDSEASGDDDYYGKRSDVDGLDDGGNGGNQSDCSYPTDDGGGCFSSDGMDEFAEDLRDGRGGWNVIM